MCKQAETFLPFNGLLFANRLRIVVRTAISLSAHRIRFLPSFAKDKSATSYFIHEPFPFDKLRINQEAIKNHILKPTVQLCNPLFQQMQM
jgi:hypothetical protein